MHLLDRFSTYYYASCNQVSCKTCESNKCNGNPNSILMVIAGAVGRFLSTAILYYLLNNIVGLYIVHSPLNDLALLHTAYPLSKTNTLCIVYL